jgi:CBS domain-containing protein
MNIETIRQMHVSEMLEDRPLFSENDRVSEAIGSLREKDEYEVFVRTEQRLSLATVRDLLRVSNPSATRLGGVAYLSPHLGQAEDLGKAARLMFEYRLRAIPSYIDGNHVKAITARSLIERIARVEHPRLRASDIMTPDPVTIQADDATSKAREIMLRRSFDHLPVIKNYKPYGVLTSSQLLFSLLPEKRAPSGFQGPENRVRFDFPVSRLCTESTVETRPESSLHDVIETVRKSRSTYVFVTFGGKVTGIITLRDVVNLLVNKQKRESPFYIVGLPDEPFEAERVKAKFERLATYLSKALPSIEEARAVIKSKDTKGVKKRYEVSINVYTPNQLWAYTEWGYDIAEVFDALGPKIKRLLGSKQSRVTRSHGDTRRKL